MQVRLLAAGVSLVLGACDGSAAPALPESSDASEIADAAAGSPKDAAADVVQLADATRASDAAPPASPRADAAQVTDATQVADAAQIADATLRPDAEQLGDAGPSWPLGMNDITILTPLPASMSTPVLLLGSDLGQDGAPMMPKDLYDRLDVPACSSGAGSSTCTGASPTFFPEDYERLHLVAVRFDLCDRNSPGTCAEGDDARLRLVWQPMRSDTYFGDAGFHAFYAIPNAELPSALAMLRDLARLQGAPVTSALAVSPGLSDPGKPKYAEGVRAFVRVHAVRSRLVRLAVNAQPATFAQVRWVLRGIERRADGMFHPMVIPGSTAVQQDVILRRPGFEGNPNVDLPAGLAGALSNSLFEAASPAAQVTMLEALLAVDHPMKVALDTAPCVACHASTLLLDARSPGGVQHLRGAYVTSHNVSIDEGRPPTMGITLRALGYAARTPVFSRRVAHETAQVLTEIEQRFP